MNDGSESITITNLSTSTFTNGDYFHQPHQWFFNYTMVPSPTLIPGAAQCLNSNDSCTGDAMSYNVWCYYQTPAGMYFGFAIIINTQIGSSSSWAVYSGNSVPPNAWDDADQWTTPPGNPAMPYTFPTSIGYNILCTPNWSGPLTLQIRIEDLPPTKGEIQ